MKGVGASLGKGDPVIVVGYVYTSEYEDRDGVRRSSVEVRATAVGPDLARSIASSRTAEIHGRATATMPPKPRTTNPRARPRRPGPTTTVGGKALPVSA